MVKRVCVVGAGIMGLSSAVCIQNHLDDCEVTIVADTFTPNTTSDGSAGFWLCFHVDPYDKNIRKWSDVTYDYLYDLANSDIAGEIGIQTISGYYYNRHGTPSDPDPPWKDQVVAFRRLSERELKVHPTARCGFGFTTCIMDVDLYLSWLTERFKSKGGKIEVKTINSLSELVKEYDAVVNCTGMGAGKILEDKLLSPIRGQVIKVYAPWVKHFYFDEDPTDEHKEVYILPGTYLVTLGGTAQYDDWNTSVQEQDKQRILDDCCKLVPSLRGAKIVKDWAGLRPLREPIRLEAEGKIVHNYGHSGSGITLHWGCALDTSRLVERILESQKSKL